MNYCILCESQTKNPKYCSRSCAAKVNNSKSPKRKRVVTNCLNCENALSGNQKKYCCSRCSQRHRRNQSVNAWLSGEDLGLTSAGILKPGLKEWLISERGEQCQKCGWNERHPTLDKVPLVADHVDGNHRNNRPHNIRLICPNCDSLQDTYKNLNRGNGRAWRRQ